MKLFSYLKLCGGLVSAALLLPAAPRSRILSCPVGTPTPESYHWNFQTEAQGLLDDVTTEARKVRDNADQLKGMMSNAEYGWESEAFELDQIRNEINDMGQKLCRLETIRRVASPWERKAIDQAAPLIAGMAGDADHAITFLDGHENYLFAPAYTSLGTDLYERSTKLVNSVTEFEKFGQVHQEDLRLEKSLGLIKRS